MDGDRYPYQCCYDELLERRKYVISCCDMALVMLGYQKILVMLIIFLKYLNRG